MKPVPAPVLLPAVLSAIASLLPLEACAQDAPAELEKVVVTGLQKSLKSAVTIKRDSNQVVDSITATDIGKLPDPNVAETLSRVPGVQSYRFGGESASPTGQGSGITIRGLTGQTASRSNGRAYFSAGQREFNIEGTSPAMVAGVDVFKNPSAEHIEGGISGVVNVRTRKPLDFRNFTAVMSAGAKYNDLAEEAKPDLFGLVANRWKLAGDGEIGVLLAGSYLQTINRGDNNPAPAGLGFRRAIRADSAEYATGVSSGLYNAAYLGRSDVSFLATVDPKTVVAADRGSLISTVGELSSTNQETYVRTRKGLNAAVQYRPNAMLELYAEGMYNYYLYQQSYRFLSPTDSRYVKGLVTMPFSATDGLATRNADGGADELLAGQRLAGGTFLGSSFTSTGGDEHRKYATSVLATGGKFRPTSTFEANLDLSYVKATQTQDNRSVTLTPAAGKTWDITRDLTGTPNTVAINGPDLGAASSWVFNQYSNGVNQSFDDDGIAVAADLKNTLDGGLLKALRYGLRYSTLNDSYRNFQYSGKNLTANGAALAANQSNAIAVSSLAGLVQASPTNFMDGKAGYGGGYLVYAPGNLLGDSVRTNFANAGIPLNAALPEIVLNRREFREKVSAAYVVGDFATANDFIRGNLGVRFVRTEENVVAQIGTQAGLVANEKQTVYTNVLPTLNATARLNDSQLVRFGFGKGMTRPDPSLLNPSVVANGTSGTAVLGNPDLRPQRATSYDLTFEHYFDGANYAAANVFYKDITGFFSNVTSCETVPAIPAYTGATPNGCTTPGQYVVTRTVNAQRGSAKGIELSIQSFLDYDFLPDGLRNFGGAASYTYVDTVNPTLMPNGVLVKSVQPFASKNSYSLTGFYDDGKLSVRVVYTYRSSALFNAIATNPVDSRYATGFGLLDASVNYNINKAWQVALTASNLTNKAPNRYYGEPGYQTSIERQHYLNGRVFGFNVRYSLGV